MTDKRLPSDNSRSDTCRNLAEILTLNLHHIKARLSDLDERVGELEATVTELLTAMAETANHAHQKQLRQHP